MEISISVASEAIEIVTGMLLNAGITGLIIEDDKELQKFLQSPTKYWDYIDDDLLNQKREDAFIKFYLNNNLVGKETLLLVENGIEKLKSIDFGFDLGKLTVKNESVDDEDWVNNWKKHYKTFSLGEKIIIKPTWEQFNNTENKIVFNIEPGHVFGTGLHHTTQLCILELEKYIKNDSIVLDLGCGTGILSIISILLGAKSADAVDIDPNAKNTAFENARLNNIGDNYNVYIGDVLTDEDLKNKIRSKKYSIVVANIIADVIIPLTGFVKEIISDNGLFICSGIILNREDDVKNALTESGYKIVSSKEKEGWVCIVAEK